MPSYTVMVGGKAVYRGQKKPVERSDGRLQLPTGQTFDKGTYRVVEHKGDTPPTPQSKGSVPPSTSKPERIKPADGWAERNIK